MNELLYFRIIDYAGISIQTILVMCDQEKILGRDNFSPYGFPPK